MRLYNTLTRSEEPFTRAPAQHRAHVYVRPAVYARGHIGNFERLSASTCFAEPEDLLATSEAGDELPDVDDRTIVGAQKAGMDLRSYTDQFIAAYLEDARALGLEEVEEMPPPTDEAT